MRVQDKMLIDEWKGNRKKTEKKTNNQKSTSFCVLRAFIETEEEEAEWKQKTKGQI